MIKFGIFKTKNALYEFINISCIFDLTPVKFRVIPVTTEFMAYQEALDIVMLNPSRAEMKRWLSRRTVSGWLGLEYPLGELPQLGRWTIRVKANGYYHDEHFYVKEYRKFDSKCKK